MATSEKQQRKLEARKLRDLERVPRKHGESGLAHWVRVQKRAGVLRIGKQTRPAVNRTLGRYSKIGDTPFFDRAQFDWVSDLEASWEAIRKEAEVGRPSTRPGLEVLLTFRRPTDTASSRDPGTQSPGSPG